MIERWLVAVRDHPNRPPALQRLVLCSLALRTDWATGRGFASVKQLGADADASEPTVRRATKWGRDSGYLLRTRRGHRISSDLVIASEWRLTQPLTGEQLGDPTAQNGQPNRSTAPTQPLTGDAPSRTVSSGSVTSARAPRGQDKPHSTACRNGGHRDCTPQWCECRCHKRQRRERPVAFGDAP